MLIETIEFIKRIVDRDYKECLEQAKLLEKMKAFPNGIDKELKRDEDSHR